MTAEAMKVPGSANRPCNIDFSTAEPVGLFNRPLPFKLKEDTVFYILGH